MQDIDSMIDFFLLEKGESISVNGVDQIALIIDTVDKLTYFDDKIIRCKNQIFTGDIVEYNNLNYLTISQIDKEENSFRARIRKCSYQIAFNWSGNIKWFDCIEESKVFDVSTGNYISLPTGNINIFLQNNLDTRDISLSQRFYITNQPFKITGIDKSQRGIIKLNCSLDLISADDDVENDIVDRWKYETVHTYTLTIDNGDTANVLLNDVLPLNVTVTDNGATVENPVIIFTSSDSNIVSVDNSGQVMGISLGQAVITAKLKYHDTILDSITVTTTENISHSYSITITGSSTVIIGFSQSYVAHIFDNGEEIFDKSVVWSIRNQDGTSTAYATITASTGNSATVKAASNSSYVNKYVILKAVLSDDDSVFNEYTIQIKSLF
ncbi:hypothetical protein SAMN05660649_03145 [Desulfotomaculum arcticum]|uniref:Ig-like domain (Group 2) n=1 Tax=Desulfotruncus arcticus DSM 17038 TaxID=1121424 RepID=A0A1I2VSZ9_9FIRM|nr:hypothetical protein [Desulfotruncus arcticus]SFG92415.1 hypothetical protein SAMN05660649_03145 [Desulfotomaculum arcticum] [Desulfotruncus arcticus DSM 17038]